VTFAIVGRCDQTNQLGVAVATYSLGVGGYCPLVETGVGALSSQSFSNPRLREPAMRLLEQGFSPSVVLGALHSLDPDLDYRQFGIVAADGTAAAWTGPKAGPWAGHIVGHGYVAMGNVLKGAGVVAAMAGAFEKDPSLELHERLVRALEAGRDAGGQQYAGGEHLPERSAVVIVHHREPYPLIDLRIDAHDTAIAELRRVRDAYRPYVDYYALRTRDPANTPTHEDWLNRHWTTGGALR
jgi:uncharacterized Ntn-hydrolase superfamily protein